VEKQEQSEGGNLGSAPTGIIQSGTRFEALQRELLRLRPDISAEKIAQLVLDKKVKVGGGFLTDQGALFLVAADLGVTLKPALVDSVRLSDLQPEMNDLHLNTRVLSFGPPRMISRTAETLLGFSFRIVLYDLSSTLAMTVWNNNEAWKLILSTWRPGDGVRIKGAYTRTTKDGSRISLFLSEKGSITRAEDQDQVISQIPSLSKRTVDLHQLRAIPQGTSVVVVGNVSSLVRTSQFRRKDGTDGSYTSFNLVSIEGDTNDSLETRVILWDNSNPEFEKLRIKERVTLLNVRPKTSDFQGTKTLELHGDGTTDILEHWDQTKAWLQEKFSLVLKRMPLGDKSGSVDNKSQNPIPFIARVLSIGQSSIEEKKDLSPFHLLLIDSSKRLISATILKDAAQYVGDLRVNDVLICKPDSFDHIGLKVSCVRKGSLAVVKPERNDIPKSSFLICTIEKLEPNSLVSLDCMILSITPSRDLQTKEGLVKRSEALLADPSGEIRLYAWRSLSKYLDGLSPGTRLWIHAVEVQSLEGKKFLVFKNYSRIEISD
jgi:hypothetical protein